MSRIVYDKRRLCLSVSIALHFSVATKWAIPIVRPLTLVATLLFVVIPTSEALGILLPKSSLIIVYLPLLITYTFFMDFITT